MSSNLILKVIYFLKLVVSIFFLYDGRFVIEFFRGFTRGKFVIWISIVK